MTLPRPALFAILGGVLILAVFAVTRTAGQTDEADAPAPAPTPAAEAPARQAADTKPAEAEPKAPARSAVPAALERSLARGKVTVLAFTQRDSADDAAVRAALRSLSGVPVFVADVNDVGDYRPLVGSLDIDRAPSVVVVDREGKARVLEGYVDAGSLRQQVEDAR